jgi:hypothetical protein
MRISDFKKVELEDGERFREHLGMVGSPHSDYMHSTIMAWSHYMDYLHTWEDENLVIMTVFNGKRQIRPPVGNPSKKAYEEVLKISRTEGTEPLISMIDSRARKEMEEMFPELEFQSHRDYYEYVYLSSDLADLPGKRYLKVRNYLNKFRRENRYQVEPVDEGNIEEIKDFLRRWCMMKGCKEEPFLLSERQANMYALENLEELALSGTAIRIDDKIEAFSIFERMSDDTTVIHYEKANFEIQGLYQAINNETALILRNRTEFINREADMGVPGLRKAKKKYGPHHMLEVYHARTDQSNCP